MVTELPPPPPAVPSRAGQVPSGSTVRTGPSAWWYLAPLVVVVLGGVVAAVMAVSGFVSVVSSIANDFDEVGAGSFALVDVADPAERVVMVEYTADVGSTLVDAPRVVVLDPSGRQVTLDRGGTQQSFSDGDRSFVLLGTFEPSELGPYRVTVGEAASSLVAGVVVGPDPVSGIVVPRLVASVVVVALSVVVALVLVVVLVVLRRRRAPEPAGGS